MKNKVAKNEIIFFKDKGQGRTAIDRNYRNRRQRSKASAFFVLHR